MTFICGMWLQRISTYTPDVYKRQSLSWIKAYVPDLDVTAQEYTDAMTLTGTKVEGFERLDKNLEKIVVGEILSIDRHPDADKLVICQVNVGDETLQIVTGAPNVLSLIHI